MHVLLTGRVPGTCILVGDRYTALQGCVTKWGKVTTQLVTHVCKHSKPIQACFDWCLRPCQNHLSKAANITVLNEESILSTSKTTMTCVDQNGNEARPTQRSGRDRVRLQNNLYQYEIYAQWPLFPAKFTSQLLLLDTVFPGQCKHINNKLAY